MLDRNPVSSFHILTGNAKQYAGGIFRYGKRYSAGAAVKKVFRDMKNQVSPSEKKAAKGRKINASVSAAASGVFCKNGNKNTIASPRHESLHLDGKDAIATDAALTIFFGALSPDPESGIGAPLISIALLCGAEALYGSLNDNNKKRVSNTLSYVKLDRLWKDDKERKKEQARKPGLTFGDILLLDVAFSTVAALGAPNKVVGVTAVALNFLLMSSAQYGFDNFLSDKSKKRVLSASSCIIKPTEKVYGFAVKSGKNALKLIPEKARSKMFKSGQSAFAGKDCIDAAGYLVGKAIERGKKVLGIYDKEKVK